MFIERSKNPFSPRRSETDLHTIRKHCAPLERDASS
jgi:hypothetical protein